MPEATKRPWYATGIHVQSAAINEDNYVCTAEGDTPEAAIANADLIVKAVNSHDALVAALKETMSALSDIINASETEPYTPEELQQNTFGKPVADAYAALEQVKS
jgi:hypothetical protein